MTQPRNFSMAGAVDLGARQAAAKRRQQVAQSPGPASGSGFVIEVTDETFNTDVVARSQAAPVIVDLWAEWCEPCKQLGPVLERLAEEAAGDWFLAKVDVDANPQLSQALQVQSIPMVIAVIGGQLVDGFLGALPEAQVRQWIGQVLQIADQLGMPARVRAEATVSGTATAVGQSGQAGQSGQVGQDAEAGAAGGAARAAAPAGPGLRGGGPAGRPGGPAGRPDGPGGQAAARAAGMTAAQAAAAEVLSDPRMRAAQDAMDVGDLNGAANALSQVLADMPDHPVAKAWLAQVELIRRVGSYDKAKVRRAAQEQPDDPEAQSRAADLELADGQVEASFNRMLGVVQRTSGQDRDKARVHLLGLFELLPPRDPMVIKARGRLSSLLF